MHSVGLFLLRLCLLSCHANKLLLLLPHVTCRIVLSKFIIQVSVRNVSYTTYNFIMPPPRGIKRWSASVVHPSVCLMSRTSALTRKPKGLGRRNFAQGYPRSHATPTPTSRSKGQKSTSRGGGILWRPPSRTACFSIRVSSSCGVNCNSRLFFFFSYACH